MKRLLICILMLCATYIVCADTQISALEREIWKLTNIERANHDLPALLYDPGLADLARYHSTNMQTQQFWSHTDLEGLDVDGRARKYYPRLIYNTIGENLAHNTLTSLKGIAAKNVTGWMNSPGHRANILNPDYTYLGVGIAVNGDDYYATQDFATSLVLALQDIPAVLSVNDELVLSFRYMKAQIPPGFGVVLSYPDSTTQFVDPAGQIVLGAEPIKVKWNHNSTFSVSIHFNAGAGTYYLGFGNAESYLQGYPLTVK